METIKRCKQIVQMTKSSLVPFRGGVVKAQEHPLKT
jgi:hypothetical protein